MHRHALNAIVLTALLVGVLASAFFLWNADRRGASLRTAEADVSTRLAALSDTFADIGSAQQRYVAPGPTDPSSFDQMGTLVRRLSDDTATLGPRLRSSDAMGVLQALATAIDALAAAEARARENLELGQPLMAADVILNDGRNTLNTMMGRLRDLRRAERTAFEAEHLALARERWIVVGATALLWIVALVLLTRGTTPREEAVDVTGAVETATAPDVVGALEIEPAAGSTPGAAHSAGPREIDLAAAAALCTDLSRVTDASTLPELLGRAATILDAAGIILWMAAGEELFAVTAHGYPPQLIARLGPIGRQADNATAAARRAGQTTTVAGANGGNGAIVAPMFGPDATIGVLAVEVPAGREQDPATQAVATMIAAQLATAVAAWPAASPAQIRTEASA